MSDPHKYAHAIADAIESVGSRLPTPEEWSAILALTVRRRIGRDRRNYQAQWHTAKKLRRAGVEPLTSLRKA